jgi:hypothetical protein
VGYQAGYNLTTGSNNIDIGNLGVSSESGIIRIGTAGAQTTTYVAGIVHSVITSGRPVYVSGTGQLGVFGSSERYKTDVQPMGARTGRLDQLRPVTFRMKTEPDGSVQYGLIAEEVDKVYPELVIRDEEGKIDGVRYEQLAPMLLNEVQQLKQRLASQARQLRDVQSELVEVRELKQQLAAMQGPIQPARGSQVKFEVARELPGRL